jgi:hypothetical protein
MLGVVGWNDFLNSKFKFLNSGFIKFSWLFFWILNLAALPVVSTVYSKKARVESMSYLSEFKNINSIVQEGNTQLPPRFYSGQWFAVFDIYDDSSYEGFKKQFISSGKNKLPNFVLFYEENELYNRVKKMKVIMPGLNYETTIEPGIVDRILYTLNPNNRNEKIFIYRNIY